MSGVWLLQKGWGGHNPWKAFYSSTLKRAGDFERLHRVESSLSWRSASAVLTLQHSHNTLMHIDIALSVASSGVAALLLEGGTTVHFRFKVPLKVHETSTCGLSLQDPGADVIRRAKICIWDEAPMAHKHQVEAVDRLLRDIMKEDFPQSSRAEAAIFGSKAFGLGGDFRQVSCVVKRGSRAQIVDASLKRSKLWPFLHQMHLIRNMRVETAGGDVTEMREFANFLLQVGEGRLPIESDPYGVRLPGDVVSPSATASELIAEVYGDDLSLLSDRDWLTGRAILSPVNSAVDEINEVASAQLPFPGEVSPFWPPLASCTSNCRLMPTSLTSPSMKLCNRCIPLWHFHLGSMLCTPVALANR